ncbi:MULTISPECIES: HAD family hydrolase [Microcoleaceae]|uniref:HAD family hydrolase n=1 Tax=Microcoleaceae TaxID=1892252 RepID=UPI001882B008|nr:MULTISPECIES: HAD family phosphatase [unclassified Tychonema]MBE9119888.1 HAD family phosphatase [Tychonema sp. LEGE 07199]MBE9130842.1 HAD family phosphatase [Tychonema sp. LEGE 07196]MBE9165632.1 HAD family phosphatase [Tychonema sp. LEGE 06208]
MTLKAVLFDFNGVIINDESIHENLIDRLMLDENLQLKRGEFREICLGKSDRACITELLQRRGRYLTETYLDRLLLGKAKAYQEKINSLETLPIYTGLAEFIDKIRVSGLKMAVVSGAMRSDIELVLERAGLAANFELIVAGDDLTASKPEPDCYLLAVELLNQKYPGLNLQPIECLALEDTFAGIESAKKAGMQVAGVTHTYPFHMIQRQANWTVDYFADLELDRVAQLCSIAPTEPAAENS